MVGTVQEMGIKGWCCKDCKGETQPMWSLGNVPELSGSTCSGGEGYLDYDTVNNPEQFQITGSCLEHLLA